MFKSDFKRSEYIGGSDFNIIFNKSKFKSPIDLLVEKSLDEDVEFSKNVYATIGNLLEPKIQKLFEIENKDDEEFIKKVNDFNIICHVDGLKNGVVQEIKCTKDDIDDVIKKYYYQGLAYAFSLNKNEVNFVSFQRNKKIEEIIKEIKEEFNLNNLGEYTNHVNSSEIEDVLKQKLDKIKIYKKDIKQKKVKYTDDEIKSAIEKVSLFIDFIYDFKNKEELTEDDVFEFNKKMGYITNEIQGFDENELFEINNNFLKLKELEQKIKNTKEKILNAMIDNDIKKLDLKDVVITKKEASERLTFDKKKFEEENGKIEDEFYKKTKTKESLTIKIK